MRLGRRRTTKFRNSDLCANSPQLKDETHQEVWNLKMEFLLPEIEDLSPRERYRKIISTSLCQRCSPFLDGLDIEPLHDRLVHVFTRYERYQYFENRSPKEVRRKELARLETSLFRTMKLLDDMPADIRNDIEGTMAFDKEMRVMPSSTSAVPNEDADLIGDLENCVFPENYDMNMVFEVLGAALRSTRKVNAEVDEPAFRAGTAKPALEQLILDLAGTYEIHTGKNARQGCYFDHFEEYKGDFLEFVVLVLDDVIPQSYQSRNALAQRIRRVLKPE